MKLINKTTPRVKNYQCNKCKGIWCHKDMYDDDLCYECMIIKMKMKINDYEMTDLDWALFIGVSMGFTVIFSTVVLFFSL